MASDRVPLGSCQVMRMSRSMSSLQKAMIQSRRTIAVKSQKSTLVMPYFSMYI